MCIDITNKIQSLQLQSLHSRSYVRQAVPCLPSIINNITKLALPILGMMALSCVPGVKAGISEYLACVADCYAMERLEEFSEFGLLACIASCAFYKIN